MRDRKFQKFYTHRNVFEAALERMSFIYDEFPNVVVNISGGKDSTVVMQLALMVAEAKKRLPVRVMFIDQEVEWDATVDYIETLRRDDRLEIDWLQIPVTITNATSYRERYFHCWDERRKADWVRPKRPGTIQVNRYGTDRFKPLFNEYLKVDFPGQRVAAIAGIRTDESPGRFQGLTGSLSYKWVTWARKQNDRAATFYPIYDWNLTDVWKAIHDHRWDYCRIYDFMYQYGIHPRDMRVSSVNHETAVYHLYYMQEMEPQTWNKIVARIDGANTVGQLAREFNTVKTLPFMFASWREYRDFLLEKLIVEDEARAILAKRFAQDDAEFIEEIYDKMHRAHITSILVHDIEDTKTAQWRAGHGSFLRRKQGVW